MAKKQYIVSACLDRAKKRVFEQTTTSRRLAEKLFFEQARLHVQDINASVDLGILNTRDEHSISSTTLAVKYTDKREVVLHPAYFA